MKKMRVFRCKRCGNVMETDMAGTPERISDRAEDKCYDPKAPGGYWYCNYEELVPKVARLVALIRNSLPSFVILWI